MKKILIIGNGNSIWIKNYIKYVLNDKSMFEVFVLNMGSHLKEDAEIFYKQSGVVTWETLSSSIFCKIPKLRSIYRKRQIKNMVKGHRFDYIHIHFVELFSVQVAMKLKDKDCKIVASFWGSDLFRVSKQNFKKLAKYWNDVYKITYSSNEMLKYLQERLDEKYHYLLH